MNTTRLFSIAAVLYLLAACASSGNNGSSDEQAAIANMNLGAGYLQQGRYDLAIDRLQRAIVQNPRLVEAHTMLALSYDQIGSLADAETHYQRATQLDSSNAAAANAYAVFLCRQNRWQEAKPFFRRAVENPTYATPDVALTNASLPSLRRAVGEAQVQQTDPISGSEDFSFFANETPGFFFFLGSQKEGTTSGDHHTPTFLADDGAVPVGIKAMSTVLLDYLERESGR